MFIVRFFLVILLKTAFQKLKITTSPTKLRINDVRSLVVKYLQTKRKCGASEQRKIPKGESGSQTQEGGSERFKCSDCNRSYKQFGSLSRHRRFECNLDPRYAFASLRNFNIQQLPLIKNFAMWINKHQESQRQQQQQHQQQQNNACAYRCDICGKGYQHRATLLRHTRHECNKPPKFRCPYCAHRTKQKGNLYQHNFKGFMYQVISFSTTPARQSPNNKNSNLRLKNISMGPGVLLALNVEIHHLKQHYCKTNDFAYDGMQYQVENPEFLSVHLLAVLQVTPATRGRKRIPLPARMLNQAIDLMNGGMSIRKAAAAIEFNSHDTLADQHLSFNITDDGYFACQKCNKKYGLKQNLRRHVRFECGGQRQFYCHLCPNKYTQNSSLHRHLFHCHNIDFRKSKMKRTEWLYDEVDI
ncbi:zinc finger protein with KRAB and SCAN domains 5-like [Copidosoma floridanum]|uniref:zinc finger protein with KRAB and SCAN domains 5-like n=1 Tax=Copidosoma floridanum TaxID=29053 RepID=UPI000C6F9961|nr:zinc finger protein with KRAB and SCAN domains 5-like [Copidosoma floridanum]